MTWDITELRPVPQQIPGIRIGADLERMTDEAIAVLAQDPDIYQRGGELVRIITDDPATWGLTREGPVVRIHRCVEDWILERLSRVQWLRPDSTGRSYLVPPPRQIARTVMARCTWPGIRPILQVAPAPTMGPDGTILAQPGYDAATGIYLASSLQVELPDAPTIDDARRGVESLLEVISDFPATAAGRSAWLSILLAVVVRPAIDGSVPMLIVTATVAGTGKGLMTDGLSCIAVGRAAAKSIYSGEDAETRKMITAALAVGADPLIVFDNIEVELGDQALDALLTMPIWRDRILGSSTMIDLPVRVVLIATGNGISVRGDLRRRALLVQLEAATENPEERSGFRHPRLLDYVRDHRARLLGAALTIVRAYHLAGRPDMRLRPMGSYEAWSDLVRSALVWAGQPDPCDTIADLRAADVRTDALRAMLGAWPAADKELVTAADLLVRATPGSSWRPALIEWCPPRAGADLPTSRALGNALRVIRRRIVGGRMVDIGGRGIHGMQWMLLAPGGEDVSRSPMHQISAPTREGGQDHRELGSDASDALIHGSRDPGEDDGDGGRS